MELIKRGRMSRLYAMLLLLACLMASLGWTSPALARAGLVATEPADGVTLVVAPKQVVLTFNEPVLPLAFTLMGPANRPLPVGTVRQHDYSVSVELPVLAASGVYQFGWRVRSHDSQVVSGAITFFTGVASNATTVASTKNLPRATVMWAAYLVLYLGLFLGVGSALLSAFSVHSEKNRNTYKWYVFPGIFAGLVLIALTGLDVLNLPLSDWHRKVVWEVAFATNMGSAMVLSLWAFALTLSMSYLPHWLVKAAALLALSLLGLSLVASAHHINSAVSLWLVYSMAWLHGVAITLWVGLLLFLLRLLQGSLSVSPAVWRRTSRWMFGTLSLLLTSGLILMYEQLASLASLWTTSYGKVLLVKLVLMFVLLGLVVCRYGLTADAVDGNVTAQKRLHRVVFVEAAMVVLILAVVVLWHFTP